MSGRLRFSFLIVLAASSMSNAPTWNRRPPELKGELVITTISRSKIDSGKDMQLCITGLLKPITGAEQRVEMFLSQETWAEFEKHVAWDRVVEAMNIVRDGMMKPPPARITYICPSCGEQRRGHALPEEPAIAAVDGCTNGASHS
jgi:hypothetical protein